MQNDRKNRRSLAAALVALSLAAALLLSAYAGGYFLLARRFPVPYYTRGPGTFAVEYRLGGRAVEILFAPIHALDVRLRPGKWKIAQRDFLADDPPSIGP